MVDRGGQGGRIVNISSVHEEACNVPDDGPYCVAKGGVRNLTRAMALELGAARHHRQRRGARDDPDAR